MATGSQPPAVLMLLTNAYDPDPRVRQEALALLKLGYSVKILAWDRDSKRPKFERMEGVDVERVFLSSTHGRGTTQLFVYAWLYLTMFWRVWRTRFDIVHCHDLDTLPLGFLAGKLKRKPIVFDAHESFPDMLIGNVHPAVIATLRRLESFLIRRIDLLITVGEKIRQHFDRLGAYRSVVVGNWKRPEDFQYSDDETLAIRRQLGIPDSALTVVCIAQLFVDRKVEELLDAVDQSPDVYLIIGGTGAMAELVRKRSASNPRICYIGFVAAHRIPGYTCAADVVYYGCDPENPNAKLFSAPNKLFEALAAGKPLITGDFGEIAEVVRTADCGIVLEHYSPALIRRAFATLADDRVRKQLGSNALQCGRTSMNWANGEKILRQEYAALLGERRTRLLHPACPGPAKSPVEAQGRRG